MGQYSYSQPSSSAASVHSEPEYFGFVRKCFCGGNVNLQTRTKEPNLGTLYYRCENWQDGTLHVTHWWDSAVEDEISSLRRGVDNNSERLTKLELDCPLELAGRVVDLEGMRAHVETLESRVNNLNDDLEKWSGGYYYLLDYYESRTWKALFMNGIDHVSKEVVMGGLAVGLVVSILANVYLLW